MGLRLLFSLICVFCISNIFTQAFLVHQIYGNSSFTKISLNQLEGRDSQEELQRRQEIRYYGRAAETGGTPTYYGYATPTSSSEPSIFSESATPSETNSYSSPVSSYSDPATSQLPSSTSFFSPTSSEYTPSSTESSSLLDPSSVSSAILPSSTSVEVSISSSSLSSSDPLTSSTFSSLSSSTSSSQPSVSSTSSSTFSSAAPTSTSSSYLSRSC